MNRYTPRPAYRAMIAAAIQREEYDVDWFARQDIERPSLNGRMVEVIFKSENYPT